MPNIKLKDKDKEEEVTLHDIEVISVPEADGGDDVEFIYPEGNIDISDLNSHDVSHYATAKVVDSDLIASNVRKNVNILGVTGTLEEGITPSGNIDITNTNSVDVTNYATAKVSDSDLVAGNIKKDVNILGITGTFEGGKPEQSKTVNLDMSSGNQTINPDSGKVLTSVTVNKPNTLVANNIKKDVNIGGIVGILAGGGYSAESIDLGDGTQEIDITDELEPSLSINENGTYDIANYAQVDVNVSGGGGSSDSGVIFIDYDGEIVEQWVSSDVARKSALPNNPSHTGLTAQGWNWSLANIKSYISNYPEAIVVVGQMYATASGLTEFDITLTKTTGLTINSNIAGNKNWGDGTTDNLRSHTYSNYGDYTITFDATSLYSDSFSPASICTNIRLGNNVKNIWEPFKNLSSLISVTIPNSITYAANSIFYYCKSLISVTIPNSLTNISGSMCSNCNSLVSASLPDTIQAVNGDMFRYCYALKLVTIPESVTTIGSRAFDTCYSLSSITIPNSVQSIGTHAFSSCSFTSIIIPNSITNISENMFNNCRSLTSITIPNSVQSIGNSAFSSCNALKSITIPNGVESIGNSVFSMCMSLSSIIIPESVTSIGNNAFETCYSLSSITIPNSITHIGSSTFSGCYSLKSIVIPSSVTSIDDRAFYICVNTFKYDFSNVLAVPTLSGTNAFNSINAICKIVVPDALYDDWIAAENWSTYANYIYKASEVE